MNIKARISKIEDRLDKLDDSQNWLSGPIPFQNRKGVNYCFVGGAWTEEIEAIELINKEVIKLAKKGKVPGSPVALLPEKEEEGGQNE
jgi:hypothetical protein